MVEFRAAGSLGRPIGQARLIVYLTALQVIEYSNWKPKPTKTIRLKQIAIALFMSLSKHSIIKLHVCDEY